MIRVLVVDDSSTFRNFVVESLNNVARNDIEVAGTAENGGVALAFLARNEVDLVILDLEMPEIDGFKVLQSVMETRPDLPFVVISGIAGGDAGLRALQLGAQYAIPKQELSSESLSQALETILG